MKLLHIRTAFLLSITMAFLRSIARKLLRPSRKLPAQHQGSPGENEELFFLVFGDSGESRLVRAFVARGSNDYIYTTAHEAVELVWDECHCGSTFAGIYHTDLHELCTAPFSNGRWVTADELPPDEARDAREMLARLVEYVNRH